MIKKDLIDKIHLKTGMEKAEVSAMVENFCIVIKQSMAKGNNIYIRDFGTFEVKKRAKKIARNISKNTALVVPEHHIPALGPAKHSLKM